MCRWPLACDYPTAPECWPGGTCSGLQPVMNRRRIPMSEADNPLHDNPNAFDLGNDHWAEYSQWAPDRELNPHRAHLPDVEKWGVLIYHRNPEGKWCAGFCTFAGDVQREVSPNATTWTVQSWEPLTISPSVLCSCGDHGFIRGGRWEPA